MALSRRPARALLAIPFLLAACDGGPTPAGATFTIRACAHAQPGGEVFRVVVLDPEEVRRGEALIGAGPRAIVGGRLVAGDGGFNQPWRWHLDPATVRFVEVSIELCDGCPSAVDRDLGYWLDQVRQFCPWSTEVIGRER